MLFPHTLFFIYLSNLIYFHIKKNMIIFHMHIRNIFPSKNFNRLKHSGS